VHAFDIQNQMLGHDLLLLAMKKRSPVLPRQL
jgi:hypothetical protein